MSKKSKFKPNNVTPFDQKLIEYIIRFPEADNTELSKLLEVTVEEVDKSRQKTDVLLSIADKSGTWHEVVVKNRDLLMRKLIDAVNDERTSTTTKAFIAMKLLQIDKLDLGTGKQELNNY